MTPSINDLKANPDYIREHMELTLNLMVKTCQGHTIGLCAKCDSAARCIQF